MIPFFRPSHQRHFGSPRVCLRGLFRHFNKPESTIRLLLLVSLLAAVLPETAQGQWFRRRFQRSSSWQQNYRPPAVRPQATPARPPIANVKSGAVSSPSTNLSSGGGTGIYSRPAGPSPDIRDFNPDGTAAAFDSDGKLPPLRVAAEFEPQRAIMLSISDWQPHHFPILSDIVRKTAGHVELLIFYNDLRQLQTVVEHFMADSIDGSHVYFSPLELDTVWLRDFGPRLAESEGGPIAIDFFYEGSRPRDETFPFDYGKQTNLMTRRVRWTVQGGNLMFNGHRTAVTSTRIFRDNAIAFPTHARPANPRAEAERMVTTALKKACNLDQLVILEPLQQELTQHVDMMITFLAPDHVLVGRLDARVDPVNAAILDRNAQRLSQVAVGQPGVESRNESTGRMRVSRIDFPARSGKQWSSLTNIILANDLVLLPRFDSDSETYIRNAEETYSRLLPGSVVKTVDLTSMKALQGALHCLSMNLPRFAPYPEKRYAYAAFREQLE